MGAQPRSRPTAAIRRIGQSTLRHQTKASTLTIAAQIHPTRPTSRSGTWQRAGSSAIHRSAPVSAIQECANGTASRSSMAAAAATASPLPIARPPSGIAGIESGSPSHDTCPKWTTDVGVTTSHTARHETMRDLVAITAASGHESGASSSSPYQRRASGVAAHRSASTAAKVS